MGAARYDRTILLREREILEHAVRSLAEQASKADELVKEAAVAGGGDHPVLLSQMWVR